MANKVNKRKQQAEETRTRIQIAALELFEKRGFENVSIEAIARAAGCSVGNIYHYYSSKEAITLHMTDHVDAVFSELAEKYKGGSCTMTAREALIDFFVEVLKIDSGEELLFQCFIHSIRHPETGVLKIDPNRAFFAVLRERIEAFLEEAGLAGEIGDNCKGGEAAHSDEIGEITVDTVMHDFIIAIRGIMVEWRIEEGAFDLEFKGHRLANLLINGYLSR